MHSQHTHEVISKKSKRILGVPFFTGSAEEAVQRMEQEGGLLVVPAAPALKDLPVRAEYREALLQADLVIADSSLMVLLWNWLEGDHLEKLSGLAYLRRLLVQPSVLQPNNTVWVMASLESADRNLDWLRSQGYVVESLDCYVAPQYESEQISDPCLLEILRARRPQHVVITIGGGTQEQLGLYLKQRLGYRPAIHCIGAALSFLSGDQVHIPEWADQRYLGWLFRCASDPLKYGARYWDARHLTSLLIQYRDRLPDTLPAAA